MTEKITRRKALKIGTTAAVGAAIVPHVSSSAQPNFTKPDGPIMPVPAQAASSATPESEIFFLPARQMAHFIRRKKLSSPEAMQADLKQIQRGNPKVKASVKLVPEVKLRVQTLATDECT